MGLTFFGAIYTHQTISWWTLLFQVLLSWTGLFCVYEIIYFINDTYASQKEKNPSLPAKGIFQRYSLKNFVITRIIGFLTITISISAVYGMIPFKVLILPTLILAISFWHNFTYSEWRVIPLVTMYVLKFNNIFYFLEGASGVVKYNLFILPAVLFLTLYYFLSKHYANQFHRQLPYSLFFAVLIAHAFFLVLVIYYSPASSLSLVYIALVHIIGSFINTVGKLYAAVNDRENAYHIHTHFSFDSSVSAQQLIKVMDSFPFKNVFLSDHNDNLTPETFIEHKRKFDRAAKSSNKNYFYGIEYDLNGGNHFLLCNLKDYKSISSFRELAYFKDKADYIYWAHPGIYFLFKVSSLKCFFDIIRNIDGVEIINIRPKRKFYSHIITFVIAFTISMLFVNKKLLVGSDLHSIEELDEIKDNYFMKAKAANA